MTRSFSLRAATLVLAAIGVLAVATSTANDEELFPTLFEMNQSIDEARPRIEAACDRTNVMEYTGAMAEPYEYQTQIDCFDLPVMGKPRKVEFMFNEGQLEFLWVLLDGSELGMVEQELQDVYGDVVYANETDKVFASGTVALRSEPAEILIGTEQLVREITGYQP